MISSSSRRTSPSSATRKAGSRPISLKLLRMINRQKLSMVIICALCTNVDWRCRWTLSGCASSAALIARLIRSRISAAAALVKVTINIRSMSTGSFSSRMRCKIRSTRTAVLPLPAAADTSRFSLRESMTCCCSSVNCITPLLSVLPFFHTPVPR